MKIAVLDGKHSGPINTLQFNPKYMMFASACSNMVRHTHTFISQTLTHSDTRTLSFTLPCQPLPHALCLSLFACVLASLCRRLIKGWGHRETVIIITQHTFLLSCCSEYAKAEHCGLLMAPYKIVSTLRHW
ncbi:hypothetical protein J4Q44_G00080270 [Coregonus suidteri]|uniref:Uncharacterized protein n=1 Tax=Coregonus suidteri TaxID=861788 RepID=A0AAN8R1M2_9TELE